MTAWVEGVRAQLLGATFEGYREAQAAFFALDVPDVTGAGLANSTPGAAR